MEHSSVLVVDDEPQVVSVLEFTLRTDGFVTHTAHDGLEAMEQVHRYHPAFMVLDVMMPRMDGWSVLEALKAMPVAERPRVVMVTALASPADRSRAIALGAEAYVPKPFDIENLLDILHNLEIGSAHVSA
ncbi:MAG: response regulator [Actinomycetota bacterium]